jgi:hypothetical protein
VELRGWTSEHMSKDLSTVPLDHEHMPGLKSILYYKISSLYAGRNENEENKVSDLKNIKHALFKERKEMQGVCAYPCACVAYVYLVCVYI